MNSWALSLISFSLLNMKKYESFIHHVTFGLLNEIIYQLKSSDCKTKEAHVSQGLLEYIAMLQNELKLYITMLIKILTIYEKKFGKEF